MYMNFHICKNFTEISQVVDSVTQQFYTRATRKQTNDGQTKQFDVNFYFKWNIFMCQVQYCK